jgi:hypothetical protein
MPRRNSSCSRLRIVCIQYNAKMNKRIKEKKNIFVNWFTVYTSKFPSVALVPKIHSWQEFFQYRSETKGYVFYIEYSTEDPRRHFLNSAKFSKGIYLQKVRRTVLYVQRVPEDILLKCTIQSCSRISAKELLYISIYCSSTRFFLV